MVRLRAHPVVSLDRLQKAMMIEAFLEDTLGDIPKDMDILDIGCGNGDISAYFSRLNSVVSIDVTDQRRPKHGSLALCVARSEMMPFSDGKFDVVVSHHVIEHVDSHDGHMEEIRRVLRPGGVCYLGTPNRSSPFMRGHVGNDMVLHYSDMLALFVKHGFFIEECYMRWLRSPRLYHCPVSWGRFIPKAVLWRMRRWYPSQCFILRPDASSR